LLWVRHFATVAELVEALREFKERHNGEWLIGRHGYRTPDQVRLATKGVTTAVASRALRHPCLVRGAVRFGSDEATPDVTAGPRRPIVTRGEIPEEFPES
jgi:hypothetical protein